MIVPLRLGRANNTFMIESQFCLV